MVNLRQYSHIVIILGVESIRVPGCVWVWDFISFCVWVCFCASRLSTFVCESMYARLRLCPSRVSMSMLCVFLLQVYTCVNVCMCVCIRLFLFLCLCRFPCLFVFLGYLSTCKFISLCVCARVCLYICFRLCHICRCLYNWVCICLCLCQCRFYGVFSLLITLASVDVYVALCVCVYIWLSVCIWCLVYNRLFARFCWCVYRTILLCADIFLFSGSQCVCDCLGIPAGVFVCVCVHLPVCFVFMSQYPCFLTLSVSVGVCFLCVYLHVCLITRM